MFNRSFTLIFGIRSVLTHTPTHARVCVRIEVNNKKIFRKVANSDIIAGIRIASHIHVSVYSGYPDTPYNL